MSASPTNRRASGSQELDGDPDGAKKRRKGSMRLSCAECRRLKLRCDRSVPCSSCVKRGCAAICPDGSLTTGQGNRFVLATTQELHEKIYELSSRVRELEDGLRAAHPEPHPLLTEELLRIKAPLQRQTAAERHASMSGSGTGAGDRSPQDGGPEPETLDAFGSLSISHSGATKYFGQIASSWYFLQNESQGEDDHDDRTRDLFNLLPPEILTMSGFFPLTPYASSEHEIERLRSLFWYLPPADKAARLRDIYYTHAAWMYDPIPREQFNEQVYLQFYDPNAATPTDDPLCTHRLALMFMVLALGSLMDPAQAAYNLEAEKYHQLARAAMLRGAAFEEPTLNAVQALYLMIFYLFFADRHGTNSGARWAIMGITVKLAQSIGLHRDSARFKVDTDETKRRRETFWEIYTYDAWQCLTFGRPPSFSLAHIDCKLPHETEDPTGSTSFHSWKHRFCSEVMSIVFDQAFGAKTPSYTTVLQLDRKVRAFPVPPILQIVGFGSAGGAGGAVTAGELGVQPYVQSDTLTMQRHIVLAIREMNLLYMHRSFFARAISDQPKDPLGSPFGTSVIAAYRSAGSYIALMRNLDVQLPHPTERLWFLWAHMFSCSIILGSIVTRCPSMSLAPSALVQLDSACELFAKAARAFRAEKVLNIMIGLRERAHLSLTQFRESKSSPTNMRAHSAVPELALSVDVEDELATLGGKTRLVSPKEPSPIVRSPGSMNPVVPLPLSNTPNEPVHPSVVEYLQTFSNHVPVGLPVPAPMPPSAAVTIHMESPAQSMFSTKALAVPHVPSTITSSRESAFQAQAMPSPLLMDTTPVSFPQYFPVFDYGLAGGDSTYATTPNQSLHSYAMEQRSDSHSPEATMQSTWQDFMMQMGMSMT